MSVARSDLVNWFYLQSVEVKLLAYADNVAVFYTDIESASNVVYLRWINSLVFLLVV